MALYPPLTEAQLGRLNRHLTELNYLKLKVSEFWFDPTKDDLDVDEVSLRMGQFRGALAALDLAAFSTWKLIGSMREENFPITSLHSEPPRKQSSAALKELLT